MTKKNKRKKPGFTVPLSIVAPIVAIPLTPSIDGWAAPVNDAKAGRWHAVGAHLVNGFQPFYQVNDPITFQGKWGLHVPRYLAMICMGVVTHIGASKLGINKALAGARIPFIRV